MGDRCVVETIDRYDVVVVGHGMGGMCASIAAANADSNVVVLEKAPEEKRGGQTQFTKGIRTAISELEPDRYPRERLESAMAYTTEDFYEDLLESSRGRADETLCRTLVEHIVEATDFLDDCGVPWRDDVYPELFAGISNAKSPGVLWLDGGGERALQALEETAADRSVDVRYEQRVFDVRRDGDGRTSGVDVETPEGTVRYRAPCVIVCAGGFESSRERVARYVDEGDLYTLRGSPYNTGDIMEAMLEAGATAEGNWSDVHATLIDPETPFDGGAGATNVVGYQYGILVNREGERFIDEGQGRYSFSYVLTKAVHCQPGKEAYAIVGERVRDYLHSLGESDPERFDNLEELAETYGIDGEQLAETVDEFSAAVEPGEFVPQHPDGNAATGIEPPKSNWAVPFGDGPYYAIPAKAGITFTLGGVKIDKHARVLDTWDDPIPGLYAAGNTTGGFFYGNYPGGSGLARASVFGRIAGKHGAAFGAER